MAKYIDVRNGVIVNALVTNGVPPAGLIQVADEADLSDLLGRSYDVATNTIGARQPARAIAVDAFFDLFTKAERVLMRQKARGDDLAVPPVPPDDDIADLMQQVELRRVINLENPKVAAGLTMLVSKGVLTAERRTQILANQAPI